MKWSSVLHLIGRWLGYAVLLLLGLQLVFWLRIVTLMGVNPGSSTFERTEAVRLHQNGRWVWKQEWADLTRISPHLQRAIIVSEDDLFLQHEGVRWDVIEKAWQRNERVQAQRPGKGVRLVGGSTITQQLAKNLFLSGERTLIRKGQEMVLTYMLEFTLSKRRILEIYLNHVEWGAGVFGAEAAARHYFGKSAWQLSEWEAARLAVMLPRPKWFEKNRDSAYWADRTEVIMLRMAGVKTP
ncbi:MAG: hypothetical protein RL657_2357 [Pseudomonadota bacterium]|jgi:monofunctional glycosyltransferase